MKLDNINLCVIVVIEQEAVKMNINKFTQKSMEAVNRLEKIAYEFGNQEIGQEHLLYSLLTIEESLIESLISKMEIDVSHFKNNVVKAESNIPNTGLCFGSLVKHV